MGKLGIAKPMMYARVIDGSTMVGNMAGAVVGVVIPYQHTSCGLPTA